LSRVSSEFAGNFVEFAESRSSASRPGKTRIFFRRHVAADPILQILPEWNGMAKYDFLYVKKRRERMLRNFEK